MPVGGDEAGDKAAEESADHGSGDVGRHGASHAASRPFFIDVSEHDGDDAGHKQALGETPEDERPQAGGSRREGGGDGQQEQRGDDDFLASPALGDHADDGSGEGDGKNGRTHGQTDL